MAKVVVGDYGSLEKALKVFKQASAPILKEYRKHSRYEKPSERRRKAMKKARSKKR